MKSFFRVVEAPEAPESTRSLESSSILDFVETTSLPRRFWRSRSGGRHSEPTVPQDRKRWIQDRLAVTRDEQADRFSVIAEQNRGILYSVAKRLVDIVGSAAALLLLSPFLLVVIFLIRRVDGGSAFYPQVRVGKNGVKFRCWKFRSMVMEADQIKNKLDHLNSHSDSRTFKVPNDPRVTTIGRFIRRASIDEMPQLWNVLRGEMSLVGPRPPVPSEVDQYDSIDLQRLAVKPGLTCIWQVSGRSRHAFPVQLEMDLHYIAHRSLWLDFKLLLLTIPAVFSADGAY